MAVRLLASYYDSSFRLDDHAGTPSFKLFFIMVNPLQDDHTGEVTI